MPAAHLSADLTHSIARIFGPGEELVGTGILVSDNHILTCAHVVSDALGQDTACPDRPTPTAEILLDFPIAAIGEKVIAHVEHWWFDEDIAGLALAQPLSIPLRPIPLKSVDDLLGQEIDAFGFPGGYDKGLWVKGTVEHRVGQGWVQITAKGPATAHFITGGFSGGPIWLSDQSGIVGITVESDSQQTAYCIPTDILIRLWPDLAEWSQPPQCPYRGLFAFREEDAPFFFGREDFTAQLVEVVRAKPLVVMLGPSGSGKSSVIFAGLVPRLRRLGDWLIADFRPGSDPFKALATTLVPLLEPNLSSTRRLVAINELAEFLTTDKVTLTDVIADILGQNPDFQSVNLQAVPSSSKFLLIADQFEELYTLCPDRDTRYHFLDFLLSATQTNQMTPYSSTSQSLHLLLTLRADFLGQALTYRPFADILQDTDIKLGPMTQVELSRAITEPVSKLNIKFEPGLAERILNDVGDEPGNLPLLEFALTELWSQQHHSQFTHDAYEAIGGVSGALTYYADQIYHRLPTDQQTQARRVFVQLVQPGEGTEDTRRLATRSELTTDWPLTKILADSRLVVTGQSPKNEETVEIVHEALIREWRQLRNWIDEDRAFRAWQERLRTDIRRWEEYEQDPELLLRGAILAQSTEWLKQRGDELNEAEQTFIQLSADTHQAQQQRELEQERRQRLLLEQEGETRRELTRALYDRVAAAMRELVGRLSAIQKEKKVDKVYEEIVDCEDMATHTSDQLINILLAMRPIILDVEGLVPALQQYAERLNTTEVLEIKFIDESLGAYRGQLSKEAEGVLFGIIEEAVGNAKKYARASKIEISLTVREEALLVEVKDDGIGFDVDKVLSSIDQSGGLIFNMMKRAEFVGGHVNTVSVLNGGTTVSIRIPFAEAGRHKE